MESHPDVVEYEITEGEHKGERFPWPPTFENYPADYGERIKSGKSLPTRASINYKIIIHDQKKYEKLMRSGRLSWTSKLEDRRSTS